MSNKSRKYAWPVTAVMAFALVAALAAFTVLAVSPGVTSAHAPDTNVSDHCPGDTLDDIVHDAVANTGGVTNADGSAHNCANPGTETMEPATPTPTVGGPTDATATEPGSPTITDIRPGNRKLMVMWSVPTSDGNSPITGYKVEWRLSDAASDVKYSSKEVSATTKSHVITGLANGKSYDVKVTAMNRVGSGDADLDTGNTPLGVPSAPRNVKVTKAMSGGVEVEWDAPSSNGDEPINFYTVKVYDGTTLRATVQFGSESKREADPSTFNPSMGGAITTASLGMPALCYTVKVTATNDNDDGNASDGANLGEGDIATVTCAGEPDFSKQVVDNVAILRWDEPSNLGAYGASVMNYVVTRKGYERNRTAASGGVAMGQHLPGEDRMWTLADSSRALWDTGLSHQTVYKYQIFAITNRYYFGKNMGYYDETEPLTAYTSTDGGLVLAPATPPSAPRSLFLSADCDDKISLGCMAPAEIGGGVNHNLNRHWNHGMIVVEDDATIDGYDVQYREVGTAAWNDLAAAGRTAELTSGLAHGKSYEFRVRATNSVGLTGPWATKSLALPPAIEPNEPTALRGEPNQSGHIVLAWSAPADADYYNDAGQILAHDSEGDLDGNGFIDLAAGETVDESTPLWRRPEDKAADNTSKKLAYLIERRNAAGEWKSLLTMPQKHEYSPEVTFGAGDDSFKEQTYTDENPPTDRRVVDYRVAAIVEECAQSDWDTKLVDVTATPPSVPQNVNATVTGTTATITWLAPAVSGRIGSAVTLISGYQIQRNGVADYRSVGPTVTSIQDTGLAGSTTYTYQVRAMSASGTSVWSTAVSVTTASQALGTPAIAAASSDAAGSATITLTPAANATKQFVWAFRVGGTDNATDGMWSSQAAGNATSVTMTGLTSGASYWFIAIAGSGDGAQTEWSRWSSWTAPVSIQ